MFDAGATERGRPYFVMELVRGVRITEYCDQNRLDTRQRLDLFVQVCHAIQHAHQKGIIHGDIKPSNIMVTLHDGVPVPKVIDFGISKATEARLTDQPLFTAYVQLIGTPAYMSPEQAEMSGLDIDTRSDIYSLGVLMYELLTGKTPFDAKELLAVRPRRDAPDVAGAGAAPALRPVRAARPDELAKTAESRQTEPSRLVSLLRGDLDWIVMRALEKDRSAPLRDRQRPGDGHPALPGQRTRHRPPAEPALPVSEAGAPEPGGVCRRRRRGRRAGGGHGRLHLAASSRSGRPGTGRWPRSSRRPACARTPRSGRRSRMPRCW